VDLRQLREVVGVTSEFDHDTTQTPYSSNIKG